VRCCRTCYREALPWELAGHGAARLSGPWALLRRLARLTLHFAVSKSQITPI
jgi:hypothetical protein